jgi:hypothetical protein
MFDLRDAGEVVRVLTSRKCDWDGFVLIGGGAKGEVNTK